MQYLGRVKVTVNGEVLDTRPGATLDLGGVQRADVVNDQAMGYSESLKPSRIEVEVSLRKGQSIEALRHLRDTTCVFECDTGQRYIVKDAYTVDTITLTGGEGGRVKLVLSGQPAQEVVS
jgi:Phage tail tube protein.